MANLLMTMGDDVENYVTDSVSYPHLKAEGPRYLVIVEGHQVFLEGHQVAETRTLEGFLLLVWGHHIFDDKFMRPTKKGAIFIAKYILGCCETTVCTPIAVKKAFKSLGLGGVLPRSAVDRLPAVMS